MNIQHCRFFVQTSTAVRTKCFTCGRYISRKTLRLGVLIPVMRDSLKWRHLPCVSQRQKSSMCQKGMATVDKLDGYMTLSHDDQQAVKSWFNDRAKVECSDATVKVSVVPTTTSSLTLRRRK